MDDLFFNERYALVLEMAPSNSDILYWGQVWKSTNDGDSWSKISTGLPKGRPKLILDSNIGTPGNRTLYCCSLGNGVYKTTNSGETWTEINTGLGADATGAWEIIINSNNSEDIIVKNYT